MWILMFTVEVKSVRKEQLNAWQMDWLGDRQTGDSREMTDILQLQHPGGHGVFSAILIQMGQLLTDVSFGPCLSEYYVFHPRQAGWSR